MSESIRWKNGARCAVALSFDVDGESPWIHRDPALAERPLHMGMGAYGPKTGMPRIMRVLDRYDVKVCFFIPGWIVERYPDMAREALRRGHEIGHHGYLHEKPFFLSGREEEEALPVKSLDIFQSVLGVPPRGSRSPSCDPSKHTMELLRTHALVYHRNVMGHPQVIGRPSRMRMVERLIQHILAKKDVWIAPPIEVAEHYLSQR